MPAVLWEQLPARCMLAVPLLTAGASTAHAALVHAAHPAGSLHS